MKAILSIAPVASLLIALNSFAQTRFAYSTDGNMHNIDPLCGTPMALAVIAESNRKDDLVHLDYNNHLGAGDNDLGDEHKRNVEQAAKAYGYGATILFDDRTQADAATASIASAINTSSPERELYLLCASSPKEMCWRGINASQASKRQFVTAIAERPRSVPLDHLDTPELTHRWHDVCTLGVKCKLILDQDRAAFNAPMPKWNWLLGFGFRGEMLHKMAMSTAGDCSPAGLTFFGLGRTQRPTMANIQGIFNASSSTSSSSSSSGGECSNNNDCKTIYSGNLQSGWKVLKCNTSTSICRCQKGNNKTRCALVVAGSSSSSSSSSGGQECGNNSQCKAIYDGNLQNGWSVLKCNTNAGVCRCQKGNTKRQCNAVMK